MHKTGNVLDYLPKSVQPKAKQAMHEIWVAETREDATVAAGWGGSSASRFKTL